MRKIIFDQFVVDGQLDHGCIRPSVKKVIKIPYYISLRSNNFGYYPITEENLPERKDFFTMMNNVFILDGGKDYITGMKNFITYFCIIDKSKSTINILNIGIFTSLIFIEKMTRINVLDDFMGFSLKDYNYIERDIYQDYLESSLDDSIREYAFIAIKKHCHLTFILNYLISTNLHYNMNHYYYLFNYLTLSRLISIKSKSLQFLNRKTKVITDSYKFFEHETDIYRMISYRYMYRVIKEKSIKDIFKVLSPDVIKEKMDLIA